jgi:hypothetical protein
LDNPFCAQSAWNIKITGTRVAHVADENAQALLRRGDQAMRTNSVTLSFADSALTMVGEALEVRLGHQRYPGMDFRGGSNTCSPSSTGPR